MEELASRAVTQRIGAKLYPIKKIPSLLAEICSDYNYLVKTITIHMRKRQNTNPTHIRSYKYPFD